MSITLPDILQSISFAIREIQERPDPEIAPELGDSFDTTCLNHQQRLTVVAHAIAKLSGLPLSQMRKTFTLDPFSDGMSVHEQNPLECVASTAFLIYTTLAGRGPHKVFCYALNTHVGDTFHDSLHSAGMPSALQEIIYRPISYQNAHTFWTVMPHDITSFVANLLHEYVGQKMQTLVPTTYTRTKHLDKQGNICLHVETNASGKEALLKAFTPLKNKLITQTLSHVVTQFPGQNYLFLDATRLNEFLGIVDATTLDDLSFSRDITLICTDDSDFSSVRWDHVADDLPAHSADVQAFSQCLLDTCNTMDIQLEQALWRLEAKMAQNEKTPTS